MPARHSLLVVNMFFIFFFTKSRLKKKDGTKTVLNLYFPYNLLRFFYKMCWAENHLKNINEFLCWWRCRNSVIFRDSVPHTAILKALKLYNCGVSPCYYASCVESKSFCKLCLPAQKRGFGRQRYLFKICLPQYLSRLTIGVVYLLLYFSKFVLSVIHRKWIASLDCVGYCA